MVHLSQNDILVDDRYAIKIADFGFTEANRGTNIRCSGNLKYLSPSQLSIDFTDIKTDLYCLGVILYEATFKKFPFSEAHTEKQLMKVVDRGVIWSKVNLNDQNYDFVEIIKKLLERNDNLCYKDYNELLLSLSNFMYKTSKITIKDIEEELKPELEAVLHKTGRVNPEDFYKTKQIYLKDIEEALEKQKYKTIDRSLKDISKKSHKKGATLAKVVSLALIVVMLATVIIMALRYI